MLINKIKETDSPAGEAGLKSYLGGIQQTMVWETWKPFIDGAEQAYIVPAVGLELYEELVAPGEKTDVQKQLRHKLAAALAWFAYVDAMPSLITMTGEGGMVVSSVPNTVAMPKWLYVEKKSQHLDLADRNMEAALAWLEYKAESFPTWKESDSYLIQKKQLISSATEATRYFPAIQHSRRLYLSIRDYYNLAEIEYVRPILGDAFFSALKVKLAGGGLLLTVDEVQALTLARKAVVHYGLMMALPYLNMNAALRLVSETDGIVNENVLDRDRLNTIRIDAQAAADRKLAELQIYLNKLASAQVFPDYFNSDLYEAPSGSYVRRPVNDPSKPYFVL